MGREDQATMTMLLPALLKRCNRLLDGRIDHMLKRYAIARSQYRVLYYVAHYGEPTQRELMSAMQVRASTLTLIVEALVQKGWLIRVKDSRDKRVNRLRLSAAGKRRFKQIPDPVSELHKVLTKGLGRHEAEALDALLHQTINTLSANKEE